MNATESAAQGEASLPGRRERKKAATRTSIATSALDLFLERGFDAVSIRDIAEQSDVAVATIFAHFSGKEALVFDEDENDARSLVAAIEQRGDRVDVLSALEKWFRAGRAADTGHAGDPDFTAFRRLVESTPALQEYWKRMWRRYEPGIASAIERTAGVDAHIAHLTAALAIEGYLLAAQDDRSDQSLTLLFRVLRSGLPATDGTGGLADS